MCFLQPFDDKEIDKYLGKALGEDKDAVLELLKKNRGLRDLATRPVLLSMIAQSFREIPEIGKTPSIATFYEVYIQKWVERDDGRTNLTKTGKEKFAEELAARLWLEDKVQIRYTELREIVEEHFKSTIRVPAHVEYAEHEVRTASFLTRDATGNYGFAHKSFMEFFLARKFASEIEDGRIVHFGKDRITVEVRDFLADMVTDKSPLLELIRNKTPEEVGYAGANIVSVLGTMRDGDLSGLDFSRCVLSRAEFGTRPLAGSDLSGAYLDGAFLSFYDCRSISFGPEQGYIAVAGDRVVDRDDVGGGSVTILDASDFAVIREIETRHGASSITYSPDKRHIIVVGDFVTSVVGDFLLFAGGGVTILDASDFAVIREIKTRYGASSITYSPDKKHIIVVSGGNEFVDGVTILDASDFAVVKEIKTRYGASSITYSPDKKHIVVVGGSGVGDGVTILDASDFVVVKEIEIKHSASSITYSPDKKHIVVVGGSGVGGGVTILDASDFAVIKKIEIKNRAFSITHSLDKKHIVVGGVSGVGGVTILDASDFAVIREIETEHGASSITYSPDRKHIVVGGGVSVGGVTILDASDFAVIKEVETKNRASSITYSPDKKHIVVVGGLVGGGVTILDASDFAVIKEIEYDVWRVIYTPDGQHIFLGAAYGDGRIIILDAESFQIVKEIVRVANDVRGMKMDGVKGLDPVWEEALRRAI